MKSIVQKKTRTQNNERALKWIKLFTITSSAQLFVQAVGLVSGIIVIRLLPTSEYALYTLANTMLGTMTLLADGGISNGVMAQGARVWQDRQKLGVVLTTGLNLRSKFSIGSLLVSTPILLYLLLHHGASWITALLIVLSLVVAFYAALSDTLLEIAPKLNQAILPIQKNQVNVGVWRLLLTGLTLFVFPWTFIAILAAGIPRIYGNLKLRKISNEFANSTALPDPEIRVEILKVVKRVLPGAIYYSMSGQITIWLISILGNTSAVAQIGALGRFAAVVTVLSGVVSTLFVPRFARLKEDSKTLLKYFCYYIGFLVLLCVGIVLMFKIFSSQALWILGPEYSALNNQLVLNIIGSCIGLITGLSYLLCASRGWLPNPLWYISLSLISVILGIQIFNVSTLEGVLIFNIFTSLIHSSIYLIYPIVKISKMPKL
ncbi:MAG: polysaccharide biosynthesis protein [Ferruginibacter sp.]|nr:polysaccharide biosynthesis protein [Ferruginibacter sp.]